MDMDRNQALWPRGPRSKVWNWEGPAPSLRPQFPSSVCVHGPDTSLHISHTRKIHCVMFTEYCWKILFSIFLSRILFWKYECKLEQIFFFCKTGFSNSRMHYRSYLIQRKLDENSHIFRDFWYLYINDFIGWITCMMSLSHFVNLLVY